MRSIKKEKMSIKTHFPRHRGLVFENKKSIFDFQGLKFKYLLISIFIGQQCLKNINNRLLIGKLGVVFVIIVVF